jgi:hypothetical protein
MQLARAGTNVARRRPVNLFDKITDAEDALQQVQIHKLSICVADQQPCFDDDEAL